MIKNIVDNISSNHKVNNDELDGNGGQIDYQSEPSFEHK